MNKELRIKNKGACTKGFRNPYSLFLIPYSKKSGFTLIEVLISMFIFVGALLVITRFGLDLAGYSLFFSENLEVQAELTQTLRVITAELRSMGPADTGAYPIAVAAGNTLTFYSDYDGNGKFEQIRYFMNGTIMLRGVTNSTGNPPQYLPANEKTSEVVHNVVSNPATIFTYYAKEYTGVGAALPSPIDIPSVRLVTVSISANQVTSQGASTASQTANITIRNFRTLQ